MRSSAEALEDGAELALRDAKRFGDGPQPSKSQAAGEVSCVTLQDVDQGAEAPLAPPSSVVAFIDLPNRAASWMLTLLMFSC